MEAWTLQVSFTLLLLFPSVAYLKVQNQHIISTAFTPLPFCGFVNMTKKGTKTEISKTERIFSKCFSCAKKKKGKKMQSQALIRSTSSLSHVHSNREIRPQENILLLRKMTYFNLHFICFTFYSKYKAQTLAIVPFEIVPQGRNISLDKHLEEKAWQDAAPQKFQSRLSLCAASQPAASS